MQCSVFLLSAQRLELISGTGNGSRGEPVLARLDDRMRELRGEDGHDDHERLSSVRERDPRNDSVNWPAVLSSHEARCKLPARRFPRHEAGWRATAA